MALSLTRRVGERIMIGEGRDAVVLTVVSVDRGRVKLDFEAPRHVTILREELKESMDASR